VVVSPADHLVMNQNQFAKIIIKAVGEAASSDHMLTVGIKPTRPETGYGYIKYKVNTRSAIKEVQTFTEKPELPKAKRFIKSGNYVWNSGIFIWGIDTIKAAFKEHLPKMDQLFAKGQDAYYTKKERSFISKIYSQCQSISIDYGIMEKAGKVYVILGAFGWSDVGSWNTLYEIKKKDRNKNVVQANAMVYDSNECLIQGPQDRLIVVQGLKGYLIADCDNVVLICEKDNEKKFRAYLKDVKAKKLTAYI
ncbi:MAG: mannose-1-phosphate guanylyltransferase, partial [Cyclobacteriaceae bacterium]